MNADLEQIEAKLTELRAERTSVEVTMTKDDLARNVEDDVDDEGLAGRTIARLERQGFGELSDRQKKQRLAKIDEAIAAAEQALREAARAEAIAAVEEKFGGVAA